LWDFTTTGGGGETGGTMTKLHIEFVAWGR
jgi:hypothetical protein